MIKKGDLMGKVFLALVFLFVGILGLWLVMAATNPSNLTFTGNTTAEFDNDGDFILNWTESGDAAVNYTIYVSDDGGTSWFLSARNTTALSYTFSNSTDANYTFRVEGENATGTLTNSSSDISMVVDTTSPLLSYATGTPETGTGASRDWIFVNITATDTNNDSLVFSLYNETSLVVQNVTAYTTTNINWTGLPEAKYTFNVTANDSATNEDSLASRDFYLDSTNPSASLSESESTRTTITVSQSCSDNLGISSCALSSASGSVSGNEITGLSCGNDYDITLTATDFAGNSDAEVVSMSTSSCGGGGGGALPFWENTILEDKQDFTELGSVSKDLSEKHRVRIMFDGQEHHVGIKSMTENSALIEVASLPREETFEIGQEEKFDLNDDGYYDLSVTLDSISSGVASVTLLSIYEEIIEVGKSPPTPSTSEPETIPAESSRSIWRSSILKWLIVVVLVAALITIIVYSTKKGYLKGVTNTLKKFSPQKNT